MAVSATLISSNDNLRVRHDFRGEASLLLTQSTQVIPDISRLNCFYVTVSGNSRCMCMKFLHDLGTFWYICFSTDDEQHLVRYIEAKLPSNFNIHIPIDFFIVFFLHIALSDLLIFPVYADVSSQSFLQKEPLI